MPVNPPVSTILYRNSLADALIQSALGVLNHALTESCDSVHQNQDHIRQLLEDHHIGKIILPGCKPGPLSGNTTGTIIERFAEIGLGSVMDDSHFHPFAMNEQWIGDFSVRAYPVAAVVSCKSFKAKERLLVSGLGIALVPTIGFAWFDDVSEFSKIRCESYLLSGFNSIYMPNRTLCALSNDARHVVNHNGQLLLRDILKFPEDLRRSFGRSGPAKGLLQTRKF